MTNWFSIAQRPSADQGKKTTVHAPSEGRYADLVLCNGVENEKSLEFQVEQCKSQEILAVENRLIQQAEDHNRKTQNYKDQQHRTTFESISPSLS
jgi:hypothetical protein